MFEIQFVCVNEQGTLRLPNRTNTEHASWVQLASLLSRRATTTGRHLDPNRNQQPLDQYPDPH